MNQERAVAASYSDAQSSAEDAAQMQAQDENGDIQIGSDIPAASAAFSETDMPSQEAERAAPGVFSAVPAAAQPGTMRLAPPRHALGDVQAANPAAIVSAAALFEEHTMEFDADRPDAAGIYSGEAEPGSLPFLENGDGRRFVLRPGVNTVGRDHTDIKISDRSVSRYHGMVVYDEERDLYSIEDSGSMNGSRVNGERLPAHRPKAIQLGDQITFGDVILRFVDAAHAAASPRQPLPYVATPEELAEAAQLIEAAPTPLLEHFLWLKLLRGEAPDEILVGQGITTIGRLPDNVVCLAEDRYVSGHHAKIEANGDVFLLLDIGSTNGTYLNGLRLTTNTAVAMNDSDEVLFGGLLFQVYKPSMDIDTHIDPVTNAFADYHEESAAMIAAGGSAAVDQHE